MDQAVDMMFACLLMLIMSVVAAAGVCSTRDKYNCPNLWKGQPALCKFWIVVGLVCFVPLFVKAFFVVVL